MNQSQIKKSCASLLLLILIASPLWATQPYHSTLQNPIIDPQNWQIFPELKGKGVRCITEATDGSIWFGIDQGVIHYDSINWKTYTDQDGIYGSAIDVLLTTKDGHIYAGSGIGISHYDGQSWSRVFPPTGDIPWTIHDLIETHDGSFWAATAWGGLHITNKDTTLYTTSHIAQTLQPYVPYLKIQTVPQHAIATQSWESGVGVQITSGTHQYAVAEKSQGLIWAIAPNSPATQQGLQVGDQIISINGRKGITQLILNGPPNSEISLEITKIGSEKTHPITLTRQTINGSFDDFRLFDVYEDQQNNIWFGLLEGDIIQYVPKQNQWRRFTSQDGLSIGALPRITQTTNGTIWTISDHPHGGLNQFNGHTWTHTFLSQLGAPNTNTSLLETQNGTLWLGSLGPLWIYQNNQWQILSLPYEIQLPTQRARLYETTQGVIWVVGLGQHAARFNNKWPHKRIWEDIQYQTEDKEGNKWFLSKEGYAIVQHENTWTAYTTQDGLIEAPTRLYMTTWGELWATGSQDSMAATAQFDGKKWHKRIHPKLSWGIDPRTVYEAPDKTLWFGAEVNKIDQRGDVGGLLHYEPQKQHSSQSPWTHLSPPQAPEGAYGIGQTADGTLWVCGWYGLRAFDGKSWTLPTEENLQNSPCEGIFIDRQGNLWVGTRRYGIFRFDGKQWAQYTTNEGLLDNNLNSILQTTSGAILIACSKGMNSFDGHSWANFAISHGDISALRQSQDGSIWANHQNAPWAKRAKPAPKAIGTYVLATIQYMPDQNPPQTNITVATPQVSSQGFTTLSWQGIDAWNTTPAQQLQYAFRLDNTQWSSFSTQQSKTYFSLPSGPHIFEVKARDQDLNTDMTPATFHFMVAYPIWQQPWFIGLLSFLIGGITIQTFRVFKRGQILARVNESLEERVQERTQQLQESRNQLELALNTANLGIWTYDLKSHRFSGSGEAGLMIGVAIEIPDITLEDFLTRLHPQYHQQVQQAFSALLDGSQSSQHLECGVVVDEEMRWIELQAQMILNTDGHPDHILGTIQDITTRRKTAQEMVKLDRLKALGEMAAGVSHNLNNILMGIIGPAQILQYRGLSEEQKVEIDTIYKSGIRASDLVKRLYQGLGDIQENLESVSIPQIVEEAIQATRPRWKDTSESKGITILIESEIAPNLPPIKGTTSGLHDIIINLIFNAIDAMPDGGKINISAAQTDAKICLTLSDTGKGMDEKTRDRIFEPFFTTKMDVGTGLGLATVYGTITRWQGDIQVSSQPNHGTEFKLYFQPWSEKVLIPLTTSQIHHTQKAHILILDDDKTVRDTLSRFLSANHHISLFETSEETLSQFKTDHFDIALIDLGLPHIPGNLICQKLKEQDPNIVTILMTGWQIDPSDARRKSADHYLQKPFADIQQIHTLIADSLKHKESRQNK